MKFYCIDNRLCDRAFSDYLKPGVVYYSLVQRGFLLAPHGMSVVSVGDLPCTFQRRDIEELTFHIGLDAYRCDQRDGWQAAINKVLKQHTGVEKLTLRGNFDARDLRAFFRACGRFEQLTTFSLLIEKDLQNPVTDETLSAIGLTPDTGSPRLTCFEFHQENCSAEVMSRLQQMYGVHFTTASKPMKPYPRPRQSGARAVLMAQPATMMATRPAQPRVAVRSAVACDQGQTTPTPDDMAIEDTLPPRLDRF